MCCLRDESASIPKKDAQNAFFRGLEDVTSSRCDTFQGKRLWRNIFCSERTFDKTKFRLKSDFCRFESPKTWKLKLRKLRLKSPKTIRFVENSVDFRNLLKKLI
jgi:transposase